MGEFEREGENRHTFAFGTPSNLSLHVLRRERKLRGDWKGAPWMFASSLDKTIELGGYHGDRLGGNESLIFHELEIGAAAHWEV